MLRSLRHYLQAQSQGYQTTDRLEERGVEKKMLLMIFLTKVKIVNQTNVGTVAQATLGKIARDGMELIWAFPSA